MGGIKQAQIDPRLIPQTDLGVISHTSWQRVLDMSSANKELGKFSCCIDLMGEFIGLLSATKSKFVNLFLICEIIIFLMSYSNLNLA